METWKKTVGYRLVASAVAQILSFAIAGSLEINALVLLTDITQMGVYYSWESLIQYKEW